MNGWQKVAGGGALALVLAMMSAACAPTERIDHGEAESPSLSWEGESALTSEMEALETAYEARLGVAVIDVSRDVTFGYRDVERFAYASTFKALLAAAVLRELPDSELGETLKWSQGDLDAAGYTPVTSEALDTGLTIRELAEATVRTSDNGAANLLLERLGGPEVFDGLLAEIGDDVTEFVDVEPGLNTVVPPATANTTSPSAFAQNLARVSVGDYLDDAGRKLLRDWMSENATGDRLVRAGAPDGWVVTDKSGGAGAVRNDIAVAYGSDGAPVILVIMSEKRDPTAPADDQLIADAASAVFAQLAR